MISPFLISLGILTGTMAAWILAFSSFTRDRKRRQGYAFKTWLYGMAFLGFVITGIWFVLSDVDVRMRYMLKTMRPLIARCETGEGHACFEVAAAYQSGKTGHCTVYNKGMRVGSRSCDFLRPDRATAAQYAQAGCDLGSLNSCSVKAALSTAPADTITQEQGQLCHRGAVHACNSLRLRYDAQLPRAYTPADVILRDWCEQAQDGSACAYLMRNRTLDLLTRFEGAPNDGNTLKDLLTMAPDILTLPVKVSSLKLTQAEADALNAYSGIMASFSQVAMQEIGTSDTALRTDIHRRMRGQILAVSIPSLSWRHPDPAS
nr:hypothetical protein [uncultured Celeribacter sp.]